jgi:hypothetical protein
MDRFAIVFGLLLCGLTVLSLFASPAKSPTQFVPMMFGIPTLFCGVVSLNPHRRRHAMPTAAIIAGVGGVVAGAEAAAAGVQLLSGRAVNPLALVIILLMAVVCFVFLGTCLAAWFRSRPRRSSASPVADRERDSPSPQPKRRGGPFEGRPAEPDRSAENNTADSDSRPADNRGRHREPVRTELRSRREPAESGDPAGAIDTMRGDRIL